MRVRVSIGLLCWKTHLLLDFGDEILPPQNTAIQHQSVSACGCVENSAPAWNVLVLQASRNDACKDKLIPVNNVIAFMNFEISVSSGAFKRSGFNPEPVTDEEEDTDPWCAWRFSLLRLFHHFRPQNLRNQPLRVEVHTA
jgi:hypothetical protein